MILGYLVEDRPDAWLVEVASTFGDAPEFGLFGKVAFPKDACAMAVDTVLPFTGTKRVAITAPREVLERAAATCFE